MNHIYLFIYLILFVCLFVYLMSLDKYEVGLNHHECNYPSISKYYMPIPFLSHHSQNWMKGPFFRTQHGTNNGFLQADSLQPAREKCIPIRSPFNFVFPPVFSSLRNPIESVACIYIYDIYGHGIYIDIRTCIYRCVCATNPSYVRHASDKPTYPL